MFVFVWEKVGLFETSGISSILGTFAEIFIPPDNLFDLRLDVVAGGASSDDGWGGWAGAGKDVEFELPASGEESLATNDPPLAELLPEAGIGL